MAKKKAPAKKAPGKKLIIKSMHATVGSVPDPKDPKGKIPYGKKIPKTPVKITIMAELESDEGDGSPTP